MFNVHCIVYRAKQHKNNILPPTLLNQIHNETAGAAFNDITSGSNRCTEGGCECKTGFEATPGWDASTGTMTST